MRTPRTAAALALLATLVLVGGCAGEAPETGPGAGTTSPGGPGDPVSPPEDEDDDAQESPGGADASGEGLTVEVDDGSGAVTRWTLTCDPVGGDHPDPEAACAAIAEAGGAGAFAPVPADSMCTQIYGGPQTARVSGTLGGALVAATFSRENGCEIARWDDLAPLLGEAGGVGEVE